jgi:hypothetical protein
MVSAGWSFPRVFQTLAAVACRQRSNLVDSAATASRRLSEQQQAPQVRAVDVALGGIQATAMGQNVTSWSQTWCADA